MGILSFKANEAAAAAQLEKNDAALKFVKDDINGKLRVLYGLHEQIHNTYEIHNQEIKDFLPLAIAGQAVRFSPLQPATDFSKADFLSRIGTPRYVISPVLHIDVMFRRLLEMKPEPTRRALLTGSATEAYKNHYGYIAGFWTQYKKSIDQNIAEYEAKRDGLLPQAESRLQKLTAFHEDLGHALRPESATPLPEIRKIFNKYADPLFTHVLKQPIAGHGSTLAALMANAVSPDDQKAAINMVVDAIGDRKKSISYLMDVAAGGVDSEILKEKVQRLTQISRHYSSGRRSEEKSGLSTGQKVAIGIGIGLILGSGS